MLNNCPAIPIRNNTRKEVCYTRDIFKDICTGGDQKKNKTYGNKNQEQSREKQKWTKKKTYLMPQEIGAVTADGGLRQ